jgi:hypothetical protein
VAGIAETLKDDEGVFAGAGGFESDILGHVRLDSIGKPILFVKIA